MPEAVAVPATGDVRAAAPLLELSGVSAGYGHVEVLHGVDLVVGEGEVVAVIGANGAGKSTLLKAVVGLVAVRAGAIAYGGARVAAPRPERLVRDGLALVPEGRLLFGPMTVRENLVLGAYGAGRERQGGDRRGLRARPRALPRPRRARRPAGGDAVRRRAADAGRRRGRSCRARACCCSTSRRWGSRPGHRRDLRGARRAARPGRHASCSSSRTRAWRSSTPTAATSCGRAASSSKGSSGDLLADESVRTIYLGAWSGEGEER